MKKDIFATSQTRNHGKLLEQFNCYLSIDFKIFSPLFQEQQGSSPVADRQNARSVNPAVTLDPHIDDVSFAGACPAEAFKTTARNFIELFDHGVNCTDEHCCRDFCWKVRPTIAFVMKCKENNISNSLVDHVEMMCVYHACMCEVDECDSFGCRHYKTAMIERHPEYVKDENKWRIFFGWIRREVAFHNELKDLDDEYNTHNQN